MLSLINITKNYAKIVFLELIIETLR